jgi:Cu+-exporting ATPase
MEQSPGLRPLADQPAGRFAHLRDATVRQAMLDFDNGRFARVTLHIPSIHCAACVWLLENLHRIEPGVGRVTVNFPTRRVTVEYASDTIGLDRVVESLAGLGYEPQLNLDQLGKPEGPRINRALWTRLGVAGFSAGNIMMLSLASYLGLESDSPEMGHFFGWVSLILALPVLLFSASGYFHSAWNSLRFRTPSIDLPVAVGLIALFGQSTWEVAAGRGEGYFDSFAGLVLLLAGRVFQDKTHAALSFERDYTAYFPLSVTRQTPAADGASASRDEIIPITRLMIGDIVVVRDRELIPADADLLEGRAWIDYSFVTGESDPISRSTGERIHAGGRQVGGPIKLVVRKEVSQSYLTSLWNRDVFRKPDTRSLSLSVDRISRWFAPGILTLALFLALFWFQRAGLETAVRVFASTLIIACPCALAMAAPYAFGSATRVLGRHGFFLRNARVVEKLSRIHSVALDKTGTLTSPGALGVEFEGRSLSPAERAAVAAVASASTHPLSRRLARHWSGTGMGSPVNVREYPGLGIEGESGGIAVRIGQASFAGMTPVGVRRPDVSEAFLSIQGQPVGRVVFPSSRRPGLDGMLSGLRGLDVNLALLSGDDARAETEWRPVFGRLASLRFGVDPHQKLEFIRAWQQEGREVLMAGDGLNDAGALRQADVGVAVTEDVTSFAPACDAILEADQLARLPLFLRFTRITIGILRACFVVSFLYNGLGLVLAARGLVSPLWSAILMPMASFSAIGLATLGVRLAAWRLGLSASPRESAPQPQPLPARAPAIA